MDVVVDVGHVYHFKHRLHGTDTLFIPQADQTSSNPPYISFLLLHVVTLRSMIALTSTSGQYITDTGTPDEQIHLATYDGFHPVIVRRRRF